MVVAFRQELHLFASVPRVDGIVEDQNPVSSLRRERKKEGVEKPLRDEQEEAPPVDPRFREEAVERVLAPGQAVLAHHLEEGLPEEDEGEEKLQNSDGGNSLPHPG